MELKQLVYFKRLAECQHMTRAAERLGVTQPFLSRVITSMEKELGVSLFDHVGRGIRLNKNGEYFYKQVSEILKSLDAACQELKRMDEIAQNTSISIASNVGLYIPGLLEYMRKQAPEIHISYTTAPAEQLLELLDSQTVDFILCSPILRERVSIESRLVLLEECPIIYPPGHWLAQAKDVRLPDLRGESFVAVKKGYGIRDTSDQFFAQVGITPHYAIESTDTRGVWELVKSGCGLAFTSFTTMIYDPVLRENYITLIEPHCQGTVGLSYLKSRRQQDLFVRFIEMTTEYFGRLKRSVWLDLPGI
ncbi:LysR family transcriptional regulator [uncultured Flavonifractor sp.]|mgnify:FL=1|uniref:LysR family transcriptional regulator n=1 Tax=uncultured Flavonifractor sp. TaxID=1193534 RepID=UPI00174D3050|nr:LysR family transcriptional regulator [uncultured Flavonifractor sp.]